MAYAEDQGIIANPDILTEDYIPPNIPARELQIKEIQFCFPQISVRN